MTKKQKKALREIIISIIGIALIVILYKVIRSQFEDNLAIKLTELACYIGVYLFIGGSVLKKSFQNIKNGNVFDENFLMSIATIGAFFLAEYTEAVAVMIFYRVGDLFESIAVGKSRNAISSLVELRPDYANVMQDGELVKVDPYDVEVGGEIIVNPGERIPLDGEIIDGDTYVDTASLTGESVPRHATVGDQVYGGTVNKDGRITVRVTKEFDDSTVAKILEMVENAGENKSEQEKFITKFARVYTPFVVFTALAVAVLVPIILQQSFTKWIARALIFLVISCPCALVISVPLSFFGGIGACSKKGVLVKGTNYLEMLSGLDTVVLDKTGTLTKGVFKVTNIVPADDSVDAEKLVCIAAAGEASSNHPIAKSIVASHLERHPGEAVDAVSDIKEIGGHGIEFNYQGTVYAVGNDKLLATKNIEIPSELQNKLEGESGSVCHICSEKYLGYIVISDEEKDDIAQTIQMLYNEGVSKTVMLTGDRESVAKDVAGKLAISEYHSELLPEDKLSILEKIIEKVHAKAKKYVAFVGDGINDAPSLTRADIGVAMGALGQDAAIEAADIVLMDDDLRKLVDAKHICKKTTTICKENIVFALGVKFGVMILGVIGLANMWLAVFADVGVSVIAILNSMRMLRTK